MILYFGNVIYKNIMIEELFLDIFEKMFGYFFIL